MRFSGAGMPTSVSKRDRPVARLPRGERGVGEDGLDELIADPQAAD